MNIGTSFGEELIAAGLGSVQFSWIVGRGVEGMHWTEDAEGRRIATNEEVSAVMAVYAAHDPTTKLPPIPDTNGFIQEVKICIGGIVAANSLAIRYPLFFAACQSENWADVQELILDAKTSSAITTAQYNAIKTASTTFNIPITL